MSEDVGPFAGTARYYSEFRPAYPTAVFELLAIEAPLTPTSRTLDLGCGTGLVALPLAERVASVTGVDVDQAMLDEAARLADEQGQTNLRWVLSRAERFDDDPGSYELVVIGSAFHWMDRPVVAAKAHQLLVPGGLFAVLGNPTPLTQIQRREGVGAAIAAIQDRWFNPDDFPRSNSMLIRPEEVIQTSPFGRSTLFSVPTCHEWDVSSLVGFLRSTSWRPDQVLGPRFADFVTELEHAVQAVEPTGRWTCDGNVEVILARR